MLQSLYSYIIILTLFVSYKVIYVFNRCFQTFFSNKPNYVFTDKRAKDFSRRVEQFEEKQGMYSYVCCPISYGHATFELQMLSLNRGQVKLSTHLHIL